MYRTASYTIADDLLAVWVPEVAVHEDDLAHVSFLSAGQEHERVPELELPGAQGGLEPRGALSYMFARAVEGQADINGDGVLQRDELWRFVRENVRMLSASRQTPNLLPNARGNEPVLRLAAAAPPAAPLSDPPAPEPNGPHQLRRLAVLHAGSGDLAVIRDTLPRVQLVSVEESPHLIWDATSSEVITGLGDVAARDVDLAALPAVVGKWEAVDTIRELSTRASLRLRVYPHDGTHRLGARIEVEITGLRHPWLDPARPFGQRYGPLPLPTAGRFGAGDAGWPVPAAPGGNRAIRCGPRRGAVGGRAAAPA